MGAGVVLAFVTAAGVIFLRRTGNGRSLRWVGYALLLMVLVLAGFMLLVGSGEEHMAGH
ncbi:MULTISPECIES: hypothetical protein [Paenibacillus]|uniref:hypothetical protein n=1 Tax=Paenibacillus TaxID=44249 RepID=UPI0022B85AC5|nr:hypothetical protein [Paenibacillus caseinilyticus]MCZ8518219.1 hypothetical protein [Paenibacillus caseinilyticus]